MGLSLGAGAPGDAQAGLGRTGPPVRPARKRDARRSRAGARARQLCRARRAGRRGRARNAACGAALALALAFVLASPAAAHDRLPPNPPPVALSATHWTAISLPAVPLGIAARGNDLWVCGWDAMIAESADGGRTWQIRHFKKHGGLLFALAFAPPDYVYAFGGAKMALASANGGATWRRWPGPGFAVNLAYFSGTGFDLLLGPGNFAVGHPLAWRPASTRHGDVVAAAVLSPGNAVLVNASPDGARSALWTTSDGGLRWRVRRFPHLSPVGITVAGGRYCAIAASNTKTLALITSPDGQRWYAVKGVRRIGYNCNGQGCRDGGWRPFAQPAAFTQPWVYPAPADPDLYAAWAAVPGVICDVGNTLRCAITGPAHPDAGDPVIQRHSRLARQPKCVRCPPPDIPLTPAGGTVFGEVQVLIRIDRRGYARDLVLTAAPSALLARAALADVARWRFRPASANERPVAETGRAVIRVGPIGAP